MNARILLLTAAFLGVCTTDVCANEAPRAQLAPVVDGVPNDEAWQIARWVDLDHSVLGTTPTPDDFSARYKVVWTQDYLYALAEITDDILIDSTPDPLKSYWNDDTLEFFIDEDASGGNHLNNDNAYAYHVALDNQVVDKGPDGSPVTYPTHVHSAWRRSVSGEYRVYWEVRIAIHPEGSQSPRRLKAGEVLGFMVAYCDSDSPEGREHFFGDVAIEPVNGDRNLGYIDASVFGTLRLTN